MTAAHSHPQEKQKVERERRMVPSERERAEGHPLIRPPVLAFCDVFPLHSPHVLKSTLHRRDGKPSSTRRYAQQWQRS